MKQVRAKIRVVVGFFMGIAASLFIYCLQAQDSISFDILFPQNWYSRTLQSCMEVWGDLDRVIADEDMPFEQRHILVDAAIGRISYCSNCLENRVNSAQVDQDDLAYLIRLLYSLDHKCEKLAGKQFDDKLSCLQVRIKQLRMQLHQLFQADSAALSSHE